MDRIHQESSTYYDMNGIPNEFLINIKWLAFFTNLQMTNIPHGSYPNINKTNIPHESLTDYRHFLMDLFLPLLPIIVTILSC